MFNATSARTKSDAELEELTNAIAAEFEDRTAGMTTQERKELASNLLIMLSNSASAAAFSAGRYAQTSNGEPAAQLGAGSSGTGGIQPITTQEALQVIAADQRFAQVGVLLQRLALGIQSPGNPAAVEVDANGDDKRLQPLRDQFAQAEQARDAAVQAKADAEAARDQAVADLATARDGWVEKSALLPLIEAAEQATGQLSTSWGSTAVAGVNDLMTAIAAAKAAVS